MIMATCDLLFRDLDRSCVLTGFQSSVYCGSHVVCQIKLSVGQDDPLC